MTERSKKPEFSLQGILGNEVTKKQLLGFIEEIILHEEKVKLAREAVKDIKGEAETALGVPSNILSELVREKLDQGSIEAKIRKLEEVKGIAVGIGISEE